MQVYFLDNIVNVIVIRKNNKNIYFRFKSKDVLEVTCHHLVSDREILKIIEKNKNSLTKMYQKTINKITKKETFTLLGKPYTLIIDESIKNIEMEEDYIKTPSMNKLNVFLKKLCKDVFQTEINKYLKIIDGLPSFDLRIRKMTTRWGVCNTKDHRVTLNLELMKKPIYCLDYVIVHELSHLIHADHSKDFWALVSENCENYKQIKKILKE